MKNNEKIGIIVIGHAGALSIGLLGGKIVIIPPEDPTWGSIIGKAEAAAALVKVEGVKSRAALTYAEAAAKEFEAKAAVAER